MVFPVPKLLKAIPLRVRFTVFFSLLSLVCLICFSALVYTEIENRLLANAEAQLSSHLEHDAEHLSHEHGGLHPSSKLHENSALSIRLWKNGQKIEDSFPKGVDDSLEAQSGRKEHGILQRWESTSGRDHYVLLGYYDLKSTKNYLITLRRVLFIGCFVALVVMVPLAFLSTTFLLRPFAELAETAARLNAEQLSFRFKEPLQNDEHRSLARSFNALLTRLERSFGEVSRFATNASHELRTPLAVIYSQADFALRRPREALEYEEALKKIRQKAEQLNAIVHRLLKIAELQKMDSGPAQPIPVAALVEEVKSAVMVTFPHQKQVETTGVSSQVVYQGNLELVLSILTNLLENAVKYSKSRVSVTAQIKNNLFSLAIEDDGPGIKKDWREKAFEPFLRSPEAAPAPGVGLGLSIVRACVHSAQGKIELQDSPLGGLRVEVCLPQLG